MLGLFLGAAILGVIITVMEDGEFPGWWPLLGCVLIASVPSFAVVISGAVEYALPAALAGAILCCFAIMFLCQMTLKRAAIAAGIYFGVQFCLGLLLAMLM